MRVFTAFFLLIGLALSGLAQATSDNCANVLSFTAFKETREARQVEAVLGRLHLLQMDTRYTEALDSAGRQCFDPGFVIADRHLAVLLRLGFVTTYGRVKANFCAAIEKDLDSLSEALEDYIRRHDPPTLQKFKGERLDSDRFY